jgi:hypothetical protein
MRALTLAVALVLCARSAWASPGVIAVGRAQVHAEPYASAAVVAEFVADYPVCLIDATNDQGVRLDVSEPMRGWVVVRLPKGRVGYLRRAEVRLENLSQTAAHLCGEGPATGPVLAASSAAASRPRTPASPRQAADNDDDDDDDPHDEFHSPLAAGTFIPLRPVRIMAGMGSGAAWLDPGVAGQHHIGTSGATFNLTVGFSIYDVVAITGSGGAAFPADHATFSQDVVPLLGGGSPSNATSSLEVQSYSLAIGPRTPFFTLSPRPNGAIAAALFANYGWASIHGIRTIEHCTNCRSEDLSFAGGTFWSGGLEIGKVSLKPRVAALLSVAYQRYAPLTGLTQELRVGFSMWFL